MDEQPTTRQSDEAIASTCDTQKPSPDEPSEFDIARALLVGEEDRLKVWNTRKRTATHPDLSQINLRKKNLAGVDLRDCILRYADLRETILIGAQLDGCDLTGADLSGAHLEGASLRNARLANTKICDATLQWCDLRSTDLRNARFGETVLTTVRLGGANLTAAQLSGDALAILNTSIAALESAAVHPRRIYFSLLGLCVFAMVTAVGTADMNLVMGVGGIRIPLLDISVSPHEFFVMMPMICMTLVVYISAHLHHLHQMVREMPEKFTDGASLTEKLTPWLQSITGNYAVDKMKPSATSEKNAMKPQWTRRILARSTQWIAPTTATVMLLSYARSRQPAQIALLGGLVLCVWIINYFTWRSSRQIRLRYYFAIAASIWCSSLLYALGAVAVLPPIVARNQDLSAKFFRNVLFRNADLAYANFHRATFQRVDFNGAVLLRSNLSQSAWKDVTLYRSRLNWTDLSEVFVTTSDLSRAELVGSNLQQAELSYISLRRSVLTGADLSNAKLTCVDLRDTDLSETNLQGVQSIDLWCNKNTLLPEGAPNNVRQACEDLSAECEQVLIQQQEDWKASHERVVLSVRLSLNQIRDQIVDSFDR